MNLGDKIRQLRERFGLSSASVSQGYLSQLENGDVKNPSAAVLLRLAQAMHANPDDLFEAAGYPSARTLRQIYQESQSAVDPDLLRYLGRLPRDRQRRLLVLLEGMENLLGHRDEDSQRATWEEQGEPPKKEAPAQGLHLTRVRGS